MSFLKFGFGAFVVVTITLACPLAMADERSASSELYTPTGMGAALSGGGVARVWDYSAADINPAGIAERRQSSAFGEVLWSGSNIRAWEVGALDNATSPIAAVAKMRQTNKITGAIDRRYTLAFASIVPDLPLIAGVAGDYVQIRNAPAKTDPNAGTHDQINLRLGGIYSINPDVQVGLRSQVFFEKKTRFENALGGSFAFAGYYFGNVDLNFDDGGLHKALLGIAVEAKSYLDLFVSYGYELRTPSHQGAAGLAITSQRFRLMYTLSKSTLAGSGLVQSLSAKLSVE